MARRRMFSAEVVNSDDFIDMPMSSQVLYFHLGIQADDDGFVAPKRVMRMVNANNDDLKVLIVKKFVIPFESGVVVIRHWHVNNYLRSDRYWPTTYFNEKRLLQLEGDVYQLSTVGIPDGSISRKVGKKEGNKRNSSKNKEIQHISSLLKPKCLQ